MTTRPGSSAASRDPAGSGAPPTDRRKLALAAVLLAIPLVALLWVSTYDKESPKLGPFPFFFWYQFAWVFICSALTYGAYRLVLSARGQRRESRRKGDS